MNQKKIQSILYTHYHWVKFFFQWLKVRIRMFFVGVNTIRWAMKNKFPLTLSEAIAMTKWNSWKHYKAHGNYWFKKENNIWLVSGPQINEFFGGAGK